jgi:large subunit ribosomal protein L30
MAKEIRITQIKSIIGAVPKHKLTMQAIGFHRTYQTLVKKDTPQLRGMLRQVCHLVRVEEVR